MADNSCLRRPLISTCSALAFNGSTKLIGSVLERTFLVVTVCEVPGTRAETAAVGRRCHVAGCHLDILTAGSAGPEVSGGTRRRSAPWSAVDQRAGHRCRPPARR